MKLNKLLRVSKILLGLVLSQNVFAAVSGVVYQDLPVNGATLNTYGVKDINELGVEGVTVNVAGFAPVITDATGAWSVPAASGNVRVEFSNWPSYLEESPDGGSGNSSVQFTSAAVVNFGLHAPSDYSNTVNPPVVMPVMSNGIANAQGDDIPAIYEFLYAYSGQNSDYFPAAANPEVAPNIGALDSEIGTVWGVAYQNTKQRYFASTFVRGHAHIEDGEGFIYVIDKSAAIGSLVHKFDLNGVVTANGGMIDLGSVCRGGGCESDPGNDGNASHYELTSSATPNYDIDGVDKVGKAAFGDIDMQPGTDFLWAVNLNQRSLIKVDVSSDVATSLPVGVDQYLIESLPGFPAAVGGVIRPFGLKFAYGKGYIGVINDAEVSGLSSDLTGYILSFDPDNISAGFTTELTIPVLDFYREDDFNNFRAWTNNWTNFDNRFGSRWSGPQPIISDIEFDPEGDMIIAIMDRGGMQLGTYNYSLDVNSTDLVDAQNLGDIYHACKTSSGFVMENGTNGCDYNFPDTDEGFDGLGEFFEDESGDGDKEGVEGALAILKGSGEVVLTILDPHPTGDRGAAYYNSQGINFNNTVTGEITDYYTTHLSSARELFGKAAGLGDVELLTVPAPIEIGNRVWLDADSDGVQDADEAGISGVTVKLLKGGAEIASAITDASGGYIFSNDANGVTTASHRYNITQLNANNDYTVRIPNIEGGSKQAALGTNTLTSSDSGEGSNADANDSDGIASGTDANITVVAADIPYSGANNHSYDFGFRSAPACVIDQPTVSTLCNDNGTPSDPSDDTFSYTINATGNNTGVTYSISGDDTQNTLAYNTDHTFQPYPISGGNLSLTLTDVDTANCTQSPVIVTAPATCSSVLPKVDLELTKTANPMTAVSGDTVTYTLTVKNNGPDDATGVEVSDQLPSGVTYANNFTATQGNYDAGTGIWTVGDLANTATATLTIDVTID